MWVHAVTGVVAATVALGASQASAAVLFEQNFDGATLASITGSGLNQFAAMAQGAGATPHVIAIVDNSLHMTNAADSSYPTIRATGSNLASTIGATPFQLNFTAAPVATVNAGNTAVSVYVYAAGRQLRLDLRVAGTSGAPAFQPRAEGGTSLANFTTATNLLVIGNPSAAPYDYTAPNGSAQTVGINEWDVWAGTGSSSLAVPMPTTASADQLQLQIPGWSGANGTISLDNIVMQTVPEPAALGMLLGASALMLRRRRA